MSKLIDELIIHTPDNPLPMCKFENDPIWYLAKPLSKSWSFRRTWKRLKDAYRVLKGRSIAVHYKQDELDEMDPDKGY